MGSYASKYAKAAACLATLTTLAHSASVCLSVCCLGAAQLQLQLQIQLLLQQLLLCCCGCFCVSSVAFHTENCKQTQTHIHTQRHTRVSAANE